MLIYYIYESGGKMDKKEEQQAIRNRILYFLKIKNMSENQLAKKANLRQSTINKTLGQGGIPRVDTLHAICDGLDISMKEFFDFEPYNINKDNKVDNSLKDILKEELKAEILSEIKKEIKKL